MDKKKSEEKKPYMLIGGHYDGKIIYQDGYAESFIHMPAVYKYAVVRDYSKMLDVAELRQQEEDRIEYQLDCVTHYVKGAEPSRLYYYRTRDGLYGLDWYDVWKRLWSAYERERINNIEFNKNKLDIWRV